MRSTAAPVLFLSSLLLFTTQCLAGPTDCETAAKVCRANCNSAPIYDNDERFPDECAKACFDSVKDCKAAPVAKKCSTFDKDCGMECLGLGGTESEQELARFGKCSDSCKAGTKNCESILKP